MKKRILIRALLCRWFLGLSLYASASSSYPESYHTNMNPASDENDGSASPFYRIANSDSFVTQFSKDKVDYFEVSSEVISTLYGQVHWRYHKEIPLPSDILDRFADSNSVMAVVGYEVDQVFEEDPNENKSFSSSMKRVPITWAYNHHYGAFLHNSKTVQSIQMRPASASERAQQATRDGHVVVTSHGMVHQVDFHDEDAVYDYPQLQFFSEANGGEMRGSWHGYPEGYAQLIQSPDRFSAAPMQIDTWNRSSDSRGYHPAPGGDPLPKSARNLNHQQLAYNGLIECPCSDRLEKVYQMTYQVVYSNGKACTGSIQNATECWHAAQQLVPSPKSRHVSFETTDPTVPQGCSIQVLFEEAPAGESHEEQYHTHRSKNSMVADSITTLVTWNPPPRTSQKCHHNSHHSTGIETAQKTSYYPNYMAFGQGSTVNVTLAMWSMANDTDNMVQITLSGPANVWLGIGFGTNTMCIHFESDECPDGGPYAIVVLGDIVQERKLDLHGPGRILPNSLVVLSNTVVVDTDGEPIRTVVLHRPLAGLSEDYYSFESNSDMDDVVPSTIPIILAKGCSLEFAQHCGHGPASLVFVPTMPSSSSGEDTPTITLCQTGIHGTLGGNTFAPASERCFPYPESDLQRQKNPTCSIETYQGGLDCCRDGLSLLDTDQEQPWPGQYLSYRLRFRFYYQDYTPPLTTAMTTTGRPSHESLVRLYRQTERRAGEYDIPACPPGTPSNQCVHIITSQWTVRDMMVDCVLDDPSWCTGEGSSNSSITAGVELIYAAPHCHAGTCLSMELYNADTGQLLCRVEPEHGRDSSKPYHEEHYLTIPPCLWSSHDPSLPPPQFLSLDTTLMSIKRNNNTFAHTGEMASWQMRGIVVPVDTTTTTTTTHESNNPEEIPPVVISMASVDDASTSNIPPAVSMEPLQQQVEQQRQRRPFLRNAETTSSDKSP